MKDNHQKNLINFWMLCLLIVLFPAFGNASLKKEHYPPYEPEEIYFFMDEPVVTASRFIQPISEAPSTILVINEKTIKERGYRNLIDVLKDLPGFDIHEHIGGQAGGTYVIQRGLWGNNKLLILKDGIKINPENGSNMVYGNHISVHGLKRIEIMYGPSSAIYGADAYSGIINLISKDVQKAKEVELAISGGSASTAEGYLLLAGQPTHNSYFQIYGHAYGTGGFDLRDIYKGYHYHHPTKGKINYYNPNEPFDIPEKDIDVSFKLGVGSFKFEGIYLHTSQPTNIAAPYITGRTQTSKDRVEIDTWNLQLSHQISITKFLNLITKVNGQIYRMDPDSRFGRKDFNNYIYERSDTFGLDSQLRYSYSNGKLIGGFEFKRISTMPYLNSREPFSGDDEYDEFPIKKIVSLDGTTIEIPSLREQNYWVYGLYLQTNHHITENFLLFIGARYDWETFNHQSSFNPRVGVIYKFRKGESIKLMYGHAYISPSAYFKYKAWADNNYAHLSPSIFGKNLDSEKIYSLELSYSKHSERFSFTLSTYFSQAVDAIQEAGKFIPVKEFIYDSTSLSNAIVEIPTNAGTQNNFGIDLYSNYKITPFLTLNFGYSFINARTRLRGHSFDSPKISNHKIIAGLTGYLGKNFAYNLRCRWRSEIHTQPQNSVYRGGTIPGIFQIDANLRWVNLLPGLDVEFTAKNLLNSKYFTAANESGDPTNGASLPRVPQDPFSFLFGLRYKF